MSDDEDYKKILLHPGKGDIPKFQENTKATFHFRAYKYEGENKPEPSLVLDDSRTMGNGPFELLIGRQFKLDVWDSVVQTMRVGEIARVICPFKKVLGYPDVSKALRTMAAQKKGLKSPRLESRRQCSFMAMQGTGYSDLDKILQERLTLCFELELLKVEQPGEYKKENWAMSDEEKSKAIVVFKEEGNQLYQDGNVSAAMEKYFEALSFLEEQIVKEKPHGETWKVLFKQKVPLLLNYAQCKLVLEDYADVIRHTTTILDEEKDNVKALYRRGKAFSALWEVEEAKRDLEKAAQLDATLSKAVEKELSSLAKRVRESEASEKKKLKGKLF